MTRLKSTLSENFFRYLRANKHHLLNLKDEFDAPIFHSNLELEAYCYLLQNIQNDLKSGYLPKYIKQHVILGNIVYQSSETEGMDLEFITFIEDNFTKNIHLSSLSQNFIQKLSFTDTFLHAVYSQAQNNEEDGLYINGLITALIDKFNIPILSTTTEFLIAICKRLYEEGYDQPEQTLFEHIAKSNIAHLINFESEYKKKILRFNGFICYLISDELKSINAFPMVNSVYQKYASAHYVNSILNTNQADFIRYKSSIASILSQGKVTEPRSWENSSDAYI